MNYGDVYVLGMGMNDLWGRDRRGEKRAKKLPKKNEKLKNSMYDIMTHMHIHK